MDKAPQAPLPMAMSQKLPRTLVLDAVGTLICPLQSISATYQRFGQKHGIRLDRDVVRQRFRDCRRELFSNHPDQPSSDASEKMQWAELVRRVFEELSDSHDLFLDLWDYYAEPTHWRLFPEIPDCLQRLRQAGITLAIGSNFDNRLVGICQHLAPLNQIPLVFYSGEIGFRKPDPRFYQEVRGGCRADQTRH